MPRRREPEVIHALTGRLSALQGAASGLIDAHVKQIYHETFPRIAAHLSTAADTAGATATTTGTKILLVLVAVLIAAVAALIVGLLGHDGNVRKSIVRGLYVFGGATVGCVVIEGALGLF